MKQFASEHNRSIEPERSHGDLKLKILPTLLIGLIILCVIYSPVSAEKISVQLNDQIAEVQITSSINQNFTRLKTSSMDLTGEDLAEFRDSLQSAIETKSTQAVVSDLSVRVSTSETRLNLTFSFKVRNITLASGDIEKVDVAWRSFKVSKNLVAQNLSFNMVGNAYVKPALEPYSNSTWARFYINGNRSVFYEEAADAAGNATLLDFEALSSPLSSWNKTLDPEHQKTTWFLPSVKPLDLRMTIEEPNETRTYVSSIELSSEIVGPSFAAIEGDSIVYTRATSEEPLMLAIVIIVLVLAIGVYIYHRRISRKQLRTKR